MTPRAGTISASNRPHAMLSVKVVPGSSRNRLAGWYGEGIKVQISAPPEGGQANKAVCELLAAELGLRAGDVSIHRGHGQPRKILKIEGLAPDQLQMRLSEKIKK